ncbi:hypothetical protein [Candidatus Uabimicrobium amorphum]|uniref:Acyl-CoA--6-aminopenicillanic acidacyl-transferase n=1 Tax=Uabimicrobium amorphum TaxID=2596890 RepID=A0A5S9ILN6_UABAM|nr:hypothetical protein [Candidatus Uabimicrobium amorphum]BBM84178.1 acyl-CoA--6-aminopenicillanic acidacyl-transferase [Candidatus Uabimicrobium amorphum]
MNKYSIILIGLLFVGFLFADGKSLQELEIAFAKDNYEIAHKTTFENQRGFIAHHKYAVNYESKAPKRVFYVEGSAYQMGYLMGTMAERDVDLMTNEFMDNVLLSFIKLDVDPKKIPEIWGTLLDIVKNETKRVLPDMPEEYVQEMKGIADGCKSVNPETRVTFDRLLMLNSGFDTLLSNFYALNQLWEKYKLSVKDLDIPIMCNAFSVFGKATKDGKHYFGRDFMFPPGDAFEFTAAMIIYRPSDDRIPLVSVAAPGFVGSIAAMNANGVAMGVDMVPSGGCDNNRPGINSLMMIRKTIHRGKDVHGAVKEVVETQRGVSWLYMIADGQTDKSVVLETGKSTDSLGAIKFPPDELKWLALLPDADFLKRFENQKHQKGLMVRWNDYKYPEKFQEFNNDLFWYHGKKINSKSWGEKGFINRKHTEKNCPEAFYFAPQRESKDDVLIMTNHYVTPSMRMCAMNPMTIEISRNKANEVQWRYDELNVQVLSNYGNIDAEKALELIDFLSPERKHPEFYKNNKKSSDGKTQRIRGSVSLFDLTDKTVKTKFGFYADDWISVTLPNYVD